MDKYYLEEKKLLETWISKNYLPNIFSDNKNQKWQLGESIEFIIKPQCNQRCKYCYITQYGDKIYPLESRISNQEILIRVKMLLEWIIENKIFIPRYELFAGDILGDKLYYKILDIFLELYTNIKNEQINNSKKWYPTLILLPTNGYYFRFKEHQDLIRNYIKKFKEIGFILGFSWSTDGLYAADSRENAIQNNTITQEDYDTIFEFMKEIKFGIHAIIAPENIKNSIQNFDWWVEMFKKHNIDALYQQNDKFPYFLEARNYYWTDEDIIEFIKLIQHIWNLKMQWNNNDKKKMAYHCFIGDGKNNTLKHLTNYDLTILHKHSAMEEDVLSCNMASLFRINLGDMSLPICHRVTYPEVNGGNFEIKDGKIIGLIPSDGLSGYMQIKLLSPKFYPKCYNCDYRDFCIKGCLGAQYEYSGEILQPIPAVCKLEQAKINTLIELYNTSGVLDEAIKNHYITKDFEQVIIYLSKKLGVYNESRTNIDN